MNILKAFYQLKDNEKIDYNKSIELKLSLNGYIRAIIEIFKERDRQVIKDIVVKKYDKQYLIFLYSNWYGFGSIAKTLNTNFLNEYLDHIITKELKEYKEDNEV